MEIKYPHIIENCIGEKIIFLDVQQSRDGEKLLVENYVKPGVGPVMHTHYLQDEQITVLEGKIGYQVQGQPEQFAGIGETVLFKKGTPHRFWNAGQEILHCKGFIQPANTSVFFLSAIFAAQNKSGKAKPEIFDAAYLLTRYSSEYDLTELPSFVKKIILPVICYIGKLLGKYEHFRNAPAPGI
ncbi:cupin domain-containing protein [Flavihumibacter fluvii]|uniref:cupin domain-containing protein n=1 Tax=Flavihumibacter fluvii TaxID=2838157 RepID=UPI001BDEACFF|nr:cupin domain-containing protein [Flavihumibacter fluvii]ULQ54699.1 cupin domain-containing protein [Flavihumibacter fluvii]